nr:hypothetical protein [Anaerolineae bacterium]
MDTLCGVGLPELVLLAVLAFVILGPTRTREVALTAGRWLGKAMRSVWWQEFTEITSAIRNLPTSLVRLAELEEAQTDLEEAIRDFSGAGKPPDSHPTSMHKDNPWGINRDSPEGDTRPEND